ncbi:GuaB1 family IMP dehydrogenase-related protein [Microbacterium testaceum]|uniref:GMP reductase n=1 Tax=Microbacterium testaceum TaxID=2033 RepID=A0A2T7WXU0_MICTE|nr:GuaB1 family IMP dehydrogenase-related protein [Microbacterium testaceum]PVE79816.1 GuaB1 family IMP dehydrogenase-related protein [Microbacterium testaceum]
MEFSGAQPDVDLTYSDVFLVPRHSEVRSRLDVDLAPADGSGATLPLVSANMNSVTGTRLAATLARRGGLGVLPQDLALPQLLEAVERVKSQPVAWDAPLVLPPTATVADARLILPPVPGRGIVVADVRDDGAIALADFRGIVPAPRLATALPDATLGDIARKDAPVVEVAQVGDPREVFALIEEAGVDIVPVVDGDRVVGTLSGRSALRDSVYRPAVDADGRLIVAAAVGVNGDVAGKAKALAAAGVDVLVVDTAHGHQAQMLRALREVAALDLGIPIAAGNVVTADGVRDLTDAGATILKVGVGPGAMCTTRMMTAVGRPQFSAVLETAEAARAAGAHVWADGGVRYPRDVALALAAGAASVMIGSWFAGTIESPGRLRSDERGLLYKESWGMASTKAVQGRFGRLDPFERARKELFAEGISSSKIYLDPQRPGLEDLLDMITSGVRSSFTYAGAATVAQFHERARVGLQSAAGYEEGKALPVSW